MRYLFVGLICLPLFCAEVANAEDEIFSSLLGAKCLKCIFKEGVSTSWHVNGVKVESDQLKGDMLFDSIDIKQGTARIIGNRGSADAILIATPSGITFVEKTGIGNLVLITVFPFYKPGSTEFCAVMSRHINMMGGPLPSQHYGTCKVWE